MNIADLTLKLNTRTISMQGTPVAVGSSTATPIPMMTPSLERRDREFLAGRGENASDVNWTAFVVSPLSFPPAAGAAPESAWPQSGDDLFWHGEQYTVTGVRIVDSGGVTVELRLIAYKTPPKATDSADPATGQRTAHFPPASTL